ncbi:LysE/ArgO family amino acid transporter [Pseudarthrobacter sp. J1738]|uniref:LysE/ArgO family amino acid transporter n=1 Tax=Pseudarthrobacter sp. J1738 TaxID=3420446 RepID=UPI003D2D9606
MNAPEIFHAAALGLGTGLALIVAIGAQNAFVLRQGILGRHVGPIVVVCALSDAILIAAGVMGTGVVINAVPTLVVVLRYVGAAFLLCYAVMAARRALAPQALNINNGPPASSGLLASLATILALTWLNPHVYLDTLVLLGTIANSQAPGAQWWFGAGAILASILWFSSLGYGARFLRGIFAKPAAWRVLDGLIAIVMASIGIITALGA